MKRLNDNFVRWLTFGVLALAFGLASALHASIPVTLNALGTGSGVLGITVNGATYTANFSSASGGEALGWANTAVPPTLFLDEGKDYVVSVSSTGLSDYMLMLSVSLQGNYSHVDSKVAIEGKYLGNIRMSEISGGLVTIRVTTDRRFAFGDMETSELDAHGELYFGMDVDASGESGGAAVYHLLDSGIYTVDFRRDAGTLTYYESGSHLQARSASGYLDIQNSGSTYVLTYYRPRADGSDYPVSGGLYDFSGGSPSCRYTLERSTPATADVVPYNTTVGTTPSAGQLIRITRELGGESRIFEIQAVPHPSNSIVVSTNIVTYYSFSETDVRYWSWRNPSSGRQGMTEINLHNLKIDSVASHSNTGNKLMKCVYDGQSRSSTILYKELRDYSDGDSTRNLAPRQTVKNGKTESTTVPMGTIAVNTTIRSQTLSPTITRQTFYSTSVGSGSLIGQPLYSGGEVSSLQESFLDGGGSNKVTNYQYTGILSNARTVTSQVRASYGGVFIRKEDMSYATASYSCSGTVYEALLTSVTKYANASSSLTTTTLAFSPRISERFLREKPIYEQNPDLSQTSHGYQKGYLVGSSWNTGSFSAWRTFTVTGKIGSSCSMIDGVPVSPLDVEAGRSVATEKIVNSAGYTLREASFVYTSSGTWEMASAVYFAYDADFCLLAKADGPLNQDGSVMDPSSRILYQAGYVGRKKQWERDETGVLSTYAYTDYEQVYTVTKTPSSSTYLNKPNLTTFRYDGAGRVTEKTISASDTSDKLTEESTYDIYGRVLTLKKPGGFKTTTEFDWDNLQTRQTNPDDGTKITQFYADGQIRSITGTAVADTSYSYEYDPSGNLVTTATVATGKWTRTVKDWLDRVLYVETATYGGQVLRVANVYNSKGQLISIDTTVSGTKQAPSKLMEYDSYGTLVREATDTNDDGLITDATDMEIKKSTVRYVKTQYTDLLTGGAITPSAAWHKISTVYIWPYGQDTALGGADRSAQCKVGSEEVELLGGFANSLAGFSQKTDELGNRTQVRTVVDRSTNEVTKFIRGTGTSQTAAEVTVAGLVVMTRNQQGMEFDNIYDGLGRQTSSTHPRNGPKQMSYVANSVLVSSVTSSDLKTESFTYDTAGRVSSVRNNLGYYTYFQYDAAGNQTHVWGDAVNPVRLEYNEAGQKTAMHCYRDGTWTGASLPSGFSAAGDTTTWVFQGSTGLLLSKTDAASRQTSFSYDSMGRVGSRTDANNRATYYTYFDLSNAVVSAGQFNGLLKLVHYTDSVTTDIGYTYHRTGKLRSVTDAAGTRTFNYFESWTDDGAGVQLNQKSALLRSELLPSFLSGLELSRAYEFASAGLANGVQASLQLGNSGAYSLSYYHDDRLRLNGIGLPDGNRISYAYENNSNMVASLTEYNASGGTGFARQYQHQSNANRLVGVVQSWASASSSTISSTATLDGLGRKDTETGTAGFYPSMLGYSSSALSQSFSYDGKSQVVAASRTSAGAALGAFSLGLGYDAQGNRSSLSANSGSGSYTTNGLNQYTSAPQGALSYDNCGNLLSDGFWTYSYDSENRLIAAISSSGNYYYKYDYLGRRVSKSGTGISERRFVYDGNALIAELDASGAFLRRHVWGIDASGVTGDGGGVGGLIWSADSGGTYWPCIDVLYNVVALFNDSGSVVAAYAYDVFGCEHASSGSQALSNPFHHAGKYLDAETGLMYYGLRYYSPVLGRFINRDPIEEKGGVNLYAFVNNNVTNAYDYMGASSFGNTWSAGSVLSSIADLLKKVAAVICAPADAKASAQVAQNAAGADEQTTSKSIATTGNEASSTQGTNPGDVKPTSKPEANATAASTDKDSKSGELHPPKELIGTPGFYDWVYSHTTDGYRTQKGSEYLLGYGKKYREKFGALAEAKKDDKGLVGVLDKIAVRLQVNLLDRINNNLALLGDRKGMMDAGFDTHHSSYEEGGLKTLSSSQKLDIFNTGALDALRSETWRTGLQLIQSLDFVYPASTDPIWGPINAGLSAGNPSQP